MQSGRELQEFLCPTSYKTWIYNWTSSAYHTLGHERDPEINYVWEKEPNPTVGKGALTLYI